MTDQHIFFDLDRTLWDFEKNSKIALTQLFHHHGLHNHIANFHAFYGHYKLKNAQLWKEYGAGRLKKEALRDERFRVTLNHFAINDEDLVKKISDGYVELSPQQTALFPNAIETLEYLKKEGYTMHIITNGFKEVQFIKLKNSGLIDFFDVIVCSEDVGYNKPNPAIFNHSLSKAAATAEKSVMIGDDYEVDVLGALNFGMKGVLFDPYNEFKSSVDGNKIKNLNELSALLPWVFKTNL